MLSKQVSPKLGCTGAKWGLGARKVNIQMREDVHQLLLVVEDGGVWWGGWAGGRD